MGRSNPMVIPFYKEHMSPWGEVALLGFSKNDMFSGDLYDLQLGNWDINSEWSLRKKYDTIICTRCAYFTKDPRDFIKRCYDNLKENGVLYVDWGLGDHWRFKNYKIGWVKNGEHEYAYKKDNFLWSTVWEESFLEDPQFRMFCEKVKKFGYTNIKKAIYQEVPKVLNLDYIKEYFNVKYSMLTLWDDMPQLYVLLQAQKMIKK